MALRQGRLFSAECSYSFSPEDNSAAQPASLQFGSQRRFLGHDAAAASTSGTRRRTILVRNSAENHVLSGSSNGDLIQLMTKTAMAAFIGASKQDSSSCRTEAVAGATVGVTLDDGLLSVGDEVGNWWVDSGGSLPSLQRVLLEAQWSFRQEVQWLFNEAETTCPREQQQEQVDVDHVTRSGNPSARTRRLAKRPRHESIAPRQVYRDSEKTRNNRPKGSVNAFLQHAKSHSKMSEEQQMHLWEIVHSTADLRRHKNRLQKKLGYEPPDHVLAEATGLSVRNVTLGLREGDFARKELILANLKFVVSVAKQYEHMGVDIGDLIQEGTFGLAQAVEKFDVRRGNKFSTYAYWWIFQAMIRSLDRYSKAVRFPFNICETVRRLNRIKALKNKPLSVEDVMEELNLPRAKAERILVASHYKLLSSHHRLRNTQRAFQQGTSIEDFLVDRNPENQPWQELEGMQVKKELEHLLMTKLEPRERDVICKRFGLDPRKTSPLSRYEIGTSCGLSRERVRQLENSALSKLRAHRERLSIDFLQQAPFGDEF